MLLVRQTVRGHRQTRDLLEKLGAIPRTRTVVRRTIPRPKSKPAEKPIKKAAKAKPGKRLSK